MKPKSMKIQIEEAKQLVKENSFLVGEIKYPWSQFAEVFTAQLNNAPLPTPKRK